MRRSLGAPFYEGDGNKDEHQIIDGIVDMTIHIIVVPESWVNPVSSLIAMQMNFNANTPSCSVI